MGNFIELFSYFFYNICAIDPEVDPLTRKKFVLNIANLGTKRVVRGAKLQHAS